MLSVLLTDGVVACCRPSLAGKRCPSLADGRSEPVASLGKLRPVVGRFVPRHELVQPVLQPGLWIVAELIRGVPDVCVGGQHITGRHGHHGAVGLLAQLGLQDFDEAEQALAPVVAQVEHLLRRPQRQRSHHTVDDVVDVREVAARPSVPVDLDGQPQLDPAREGEVGHVGPAPGPVHCEEAEPRQPEPVQPVVDVGDGLVSLLGGRIQRVWAVHAV
mmetsp:Transcript_17298/g.56588  ORF Transcript_17298/g.56588 Transcript_17298/m.56588 type:complete len:217 (+) Transcript_17298:654-1304(+)